MRRLWLLGGFRAEADGQRVTLGSRAARTLVAYLALNPDRALSREHLAALLWPDREPGDGRRLLRGELHRARTTLGDGWMETTGETVTGGQILVDATTFVGLVREGLAAQSVWDQRRLLREAVELWSGPLLGGDADPPLEEAARELDRRYTEALWRLTVACRSGGNLEEALRWARQLVRHEPLREDAHREVIRLCARLGRPTEALGHYRELERLLDRELGVMPSAESRQLHEEISRVRDTGPAPEPAPAAVGDALDVPLVGREVERAVGRRTVDATVQRDGRVLLIEGDAGAGKTRLARTFAEDASWWRGMEVMWVTVTANAGPGGPLARALDSLDPVTAGHVRDRLGDDLAGLLAPLVGMFDRRRAPRPPVGATLGPDAAAAEERVREALVRALLAAADARPALLVVDDAHLADSSTWRTILALARRGRNEPLSALICYRDEVRDRPDVWETLRAVDAAPGTVRLRLGPLTADAATELARVLAPDDPDPAGLAGHVVERTGGLPLDVIEALRASPGTRRDHPADRRADRVRALDPAARRVAEILAAHDGPCSHRRLVRLAHTCGVDESDLAAALSRLLHAGLVTADTEHVSLTHALTAAAVIEATNPARLASAHRAVAAALEADRAHPHQVARHHTAAGDHALAHRSHVDAAREAAAAHDYPAAAAHWAAAHDHARHVDLPDGERLGLLLDEAETLRVVGDTERHTQVLDEAERLARTDRDHARVSTARLGSVTHTADVGLFERTAERAVARARASGDRAVLARALYEHGYALQRRGWAARAVGPLREAVSLLDGDPKGQARARTTLGSALRQTQQYDEAREHLHAALGAHTAEGDRSGMATSLNAIAGLLAETGDMAQAADRCEEAWQLADQIGDRRIAGLALGNHGATMVQLGHLARTVEVWERALRIHEEDGQETMAALDRARLAWLHAGFFGEAAEATRLLDEAEPLLVAADNTRDLGNLKTIRARVAVINGDLDRALCHLDRGIVMLDEAEDGYVGAQARVQRAETLVLAGRHDEALAAAEQAVELVRETGLVDVLPWAMAVRTFGLLGLGRHDEAAETAEAAGQAAAEASTPFFAHVVELARHWAFAAAGRRADAVAAASAAWEDITRMLDGLADDRRERAAERVWSFRQVAIAVAATTSRWQTIRLARVDAPTGRPLDPDETVEIRWEVHRPSDLDVADGPARRRVRIVRLAAQAADAGAAPTVADLASTLGCSESTVRRDLAALRREGELAPTRGSPGQPTNVE